MKIVIISDTHAEYTQLQFPDIEIDLLIVAGDFTHHSKNPKDLKDFAKWICKHKNIHEAVVCCGNSEMMAKHLGKDDLKKYIEIEPHIHYLQDELKSLTKYRINIYASPWNTSSNMGFSASRTELEKIFRVIPEETEILVTHMPPHNIMDLTIRGRACGSHSLRKKVEELPNLKLHVFGHVHEYGGEAYVLNTNSSTVTFINGAMKNIYSAITGKRFRTPIIIEYDSQTKKITPIEGLSIRSTPYEESSQIVTNTIHYFQKY